LEFFGHADFSNVPGERSLFQDVLVEDGYTKVPKNLLVGFRDVRVIRSFLFLGKETRDFVEKGERKSAKEAFFPRAHSVKKRGAG